MAVESSLDLVEVAPDSTPPVCKIMDYGKIRYNKAKKGKTKSRSTHLKEIKLSPRIAEHDLGVKVKNIRKFLLSGDMVKVHMVFRGREIAHSKIGSLIMQEMTESIKDIGNVESLPKMQGRVLSMLIVPR